MSLRHAAWLLLAATGAVWAARAAPAPAPQPAASAAAPFLWQVQTAKARHVLMGSVHLLPASAHPLPPALEAAYAATRELVLEADLAALSEPALQNRMLGAGREDRPGGLRAQIGKPLYQKLQQHAGRIGMPTPVCAEFRAWFCALALEMHPLLQAGFSAEHGIDQHFYTRAREDGRPVAGLETAEHQVALFTTMPDALGKQILVATLDETTYSSQSPEELYRIWRTGDFATLERLMKDMRQRYPELYARLLTERNRAWIPTLVQRLSGEVPQLVIVGAAHFVGSDGLLALLKAQGFDAVPAPGIAGSDGPAPSADVRPAVPGHAP